MEKRYKIVFCDLDGTLIKPITNNKFPKGIWDMQIQFNVLDKINEMKPEYIFIVTNQGGIGKFVSEEAFTAKLDYIMYSIREYTNVFTDAIFCPSIDKEDLYRKPNTGMIDHMIEIHTLYNVPKQEILMIGDASGLPGQFSDSDKKLAENYEIDYIDVNELISK